MIEGKCEELRIGFSKLTTKFERIKIYDNPQEVVRCANILGLTVSNDLKWNEDVQHITKKARKRLHCLTQLKRATVMLALNNCFSSTLHVSDRFQHMRARHFKTA